MSQAVAGTDIARASLWKGRSVNGQEKETALGLYVTAKIEARLDGLKVNLPPEPMIVGAVGAALFALDRARQASPALNEQVAG
jgi:hypothetical protein